MTISNLAIYTWMPTRTGLVCALRSKADLWSAYISSLSTLTVVNSQLVIALAIGILIGFCGGTHLADQLMFAISNTGPLWSVALLQPSLQQDSNIQQSKQLPAQQSGDYLWQDQASEQIMLRVRAPIPNEETITPLIEDALRHLHDFSYLGQHPLAQLESVKRQQLLRSGAARFNTHLELGRALHTLLVNMIGQLHPTGQLPTGAVIPPREWHPYIILHASYVQGELTREIMAQLYIGEGTYNRTRRRAIASVARAIREIEHQTRP